LSKRVLLGSRLTAWAKAFKGFYDANDPIARQDFVARLLFSSRSLILVISAQAAAIAGLLAYIDHAFDPLNFILILVAFVAIHAASNLMNDYFGFIKGHDTEDSPRRRYTLHPIADNILTANEIKLTIIVLLAVDLVIGCYFFLVRGFFVVLLAVVGAVMLLLYDAAQRPLKSIGLGEFASFVVWGPLMIFGGYFIIAGRFSVDAFLVSLPYGLGVMSILVGKHIDQEAYDAEKGIHTLPVMLGEARARTLAIVSIVLMYAFTVVSIVYGAMAITALLVVLNYKRFTGAIRVLSKERPSGPPKGYVGWPLWYHRQCLTHSKGFGWLYIIALLVAAVLANTQVSRYEFVRLALALKPMVHLML
jgi:1,4-dihydroxy-2-naphthoate octaprenyltransferase